MAVTVSEGYFRESTIGTTCQGTLTYYVFGTDDETVAHPAALAAAVGDFPFGYRALPFKDSPIKHIAPGVHEVKFNFNLDMQQTGESDPDNPDTPTFNTSLTFNLVGGTSHISNSLAVTQTAVAAGFTAMDFKGAIGVEFSTDGTNAQVRGVDIFSPVMDYTITTQFKNSVVTNDYVDALFELTGKTNAATFYRRPAGEVLFKGARGSKHGQDLWEISFEFSRSPNKTGITVGDITGINKLGWQYLDILYRPAADRVNGLQVLVPKQAVVHTVYEAGDFTAMKIGGS